jgi:hypothetical protein
MSDPNCRNWCTDFPDRCDQAKKDLCMRHGGDLEECGCIAPQRNETYQRFIKQVQSIGLPLPTTASYCWNPLCDGEDMTDTLKTQNIVGGEKRCPAQQLSICNQIIQLQDGASENVIDNVDFKVVCGQNLPEPKKPDPRPSLDDPDDPKDPKNPNDPNDPNDPSGDPLARVRQWWDSLTQEEQQVVMGSSALVVVGFVLLLMRR